MATHDYNIANQTALNFRGDLNDALEAIVSTNSNATAPTTTYAHMFWYDTTNDLLKMRDESNSAWITLGYVDQSNLQFQPYIGGFRLGGVLDEDNMASNSALKVPTQQSVKAYVDALDTSPDGVDIRNRFAGIYTKPADSWQNITGYSGASVITVEGYRTSAGTKSTLQISFSTDGGNSWGSIIDLGYAYGSVSELSLFKAVVDFSSGTYMTTGWDDSYQNRSSGTFTARSSNTNAFRLRVTDQDSVFSVMIEQGFGS